MKRNNGFTAFFIASIFGITVASATLFNGWENYDDVINAETILWSGSSDISWYDSGEKTLHISNAEEFSGFIDILNRGIDFNDQTIIIDNDIYK